MTEWLSDGMGSGLKKRPVVLIKGRGMGRWVFECVTGWLLRWLDRWNWLAV